MSAQVILRLSPFDSANEVEYIDPGLTIQEFLEQRELLEFAMPTICIYNDEPLLRAEWPKTVIEDGDSVVFKAYPEGTIIWAVVASVAVSAAAYVLLPKPDVPTIVGYEQSPTYNLQAQSNQARLYQPIADHYGKVRAWMDLAAQPYREFGGNNEEILYQLFLVGQGEYDYEALKVEDTEASNFEEIEAEFIGPGDDVTLFPDNVETSVEVSDINLDSTGYRGPFIANATNTDANYLAFDFEAPRGIYEVNEKDGQFRQWTGLRIQMEAREIDDAGVAIGGWNILANSVITAFNRDPRRLTRRFSVSPGRYEVRVRRTTLISGSQYVFDDISWTGLKAYITGDQNYGDVSLIAVKANASADLSARSQFRFNIVATRKIPTWNGSSWTANTATQDIAPAIKAILNSAHGGNKSDDQIDLTALQALDAIWKARGDKFNFRFDQAGNLWRNLQTILRAGRAAPVMDGDIVSFTRHEPQSVPVTMFTPSNMLPNTFSISDTFPDEETPDHIIVQYFDETTWRQEEVVCTLSGDTELRPRKIQIPGITSRQQAYQEGMYERARLKNMTTAVRFDTELEGLIPQYLQLIAISHDMPSWQTSGELVEIVSTTYVLSEAVTFGGGTHYIGFRKPNGSLAGPFVCTAGATPYEVVITDALGFTPITGGSQVRTHFMFGNSSTWEQLAVVESVDPKGDRVTITALLEIDAVHDAVGTAPALDYSYQLEPDVIRPVVSGLRILEDTDPYTAIASWNSAAGATKYILQRSSDSGATWEPAGETRGTRIPITLEQGQFLLRLAGVGQLRGDWLQITVNLQGKPRLNYTADVFYQTSAPTDPPSDLELGDIWIELDGSDTAIAGYEYRSKEPGTWADPTVPEYFWILDDTTNLQIVSLKSSYNASLASGDIGNKTFSGPSSSQPTAENIGDLWYQTDTKIQVRWNGVDWNDIVANLVNNTSELTDDAGLGESADWDNVTGANKPEDNANNTTDTSQLNDDAGLGNTANWPDVTGPDKPDDNATNNGPGGSNVGANNVPESSIQTGAVSTDKMPNNAVTEMTFVDYGPGSVPGLSSWVARRSGAQTVWNVNALVNDNGSNPTSYDLYWKIEENGVIVDSGTLWIYSYGVDPLTVAYEHGPIGGLRLVVQCYVHGTTTYVSNGFLQITSWTGKK